MRNIFFLLAILSAGVIKSEHGQYFEHNRFPYPFNISMSAYTASPMAIPGLSYQGKPGLYGLPSEQELVEKYRCQDSLIDEILKNRIIIDVARNRSSKQPINLAETGMSMFNEGHTPVALHQDIPNYVIKFTGALERLEGREILQNICDRNTALCQNIVIPEKCIVPIKEAEVTLYILLAKKLEFLNLYSSDIDLNEFLQQKSDLFERVKFLLYQAGHCDGNPGNVKITPLGDFAVVDTDLPFYLKPNSWCGSTEYLELVYYYAIRQSQQAMCFPYSSVFQFYNYSTYDYYNLGNFDFSQKFRAQMLKKQLDDLLKNTPGTPQAHEFCIFYPTDQFFEYNL